MFITLWFVYIWCAHFQVCRTFDAVSAHILNSTFLRLQNQTLQRFQEIKSKMPRRESARRTHHLACESDIIETLHMRLTLMQMSFGKHIERKHCCFFPGEILDEVYHILNYIRVTPKLHRPYKVTDELFDLSTMAMEYFKEKIEPDLPEIAYFGSEFFNFSNSFPGKCSRTVWRVWNGSYWKVLKVKSTQTHFIRICFLTHSSALSIVGLFEILHGC